MSWPQSWFKTDFGDPTQRFIYVNGAPFDGHSDSARPLVRVLRSPTTSIHGIASAFVGAAIALCLPGSVAVVALLSFLFGSPSYNILVQRDYLKKQWEDHPSLRNVFIDKAGRVQNDPNAFARVDGYYRYEIAYRRGEMLWLATAGAAIITITGIAAGAPLWIAAAVSLAGAAVGATPSALRLGWALHARDRLHRADKPWTVTTDPPPLRRKAPSPARRQLALAAVGARVRQSL